MEKKKKVAVAMSGGVDSSVSATLLLEEGYEVTGVFIKTWSAPWMPCTWREERRDAMRVAAQLHIPFRTLDLSKEYEEEVVRYMIDEYKKGNTPNPDVMCNKHIKFGGFFQWAMKEGFDFVATGHYAQVKCEGGECQLCAGTDKNKDQSYFLWTLTQEQLMKTFFPVGHMEKNDVRKLAEKFELITAQKKDSQGICFLGKVDMKEFLSHYIDQSPGDVLNTKGEVIGVHDGAVFLTLGQRHGFTILQKSPNTPIYYVVKKDIPKNTITVATQEEVQKSLAQTITVREINLISATPFDSLTCEARLRYRQTLFPVTVTKEENMFSVTLLEPQPFIQSGQSMVFYKDNCCLGGGIIV